MRSGYSRRASAVSAESFSLDLVPLNCARRASTIFLAAVNLQLQANSRSRDRVLLGSPRVPVLHTGLDRFVETGRRVRFEGL